MHADRYSLLTADSPGALAVIRVRGPGVERLLRSRFSRQAARGRAVHGEWRDATVDEVIDDPVVALLSGDEAELSVHGGPEVVRRVRASLEAEGFVPEAAAGDVIESLIPLCRTGLALRTLLAQREAGLPEAPERWRSGLHRLLHPARVAVVGPANVGKSTLVNRLCRRDVAIVADIAGTTRDYVEADAELDVDSEVARGGVGASDDSGEADLHSRAVAGHDAIDEGRSEGRSEERADGGVPVIVLDTPGVRETRDAVESAAIGLARNVIDTADVRVVVVDAVAPAWEWCDCWPGSVVVANRCDLPHRTLPDGVLAVSARTGHGLPDLVRDIRERLGIPPEPWRWRYPPGD